MFIFFTAETEPHEGKRKQESLWPIFKIHHQKSRYIYDLFYRRKAISRGKFPLILIVFRNYSISTFFILLNNILPFIQSSFALMLYYFQNCMTIV